MKCCKCGGRHLARCVVYQEAEVMLRVKLVDWLSYAEAVKMVSLAKDRWCHPGMKVQEVKVRWQV